MENNIFLTRTNLILLFLFCPVLLKNGMLGSFMVVAITICLMFPSVLKNRNVFPVSLYYGSVIFVLFLLLNTIVTVVSPFYPLKFFSYVVSFLFGYLICHMGITPYCSKKYICFIIIIPLFVFFFVKEKMEGGLFDLANTYVYYGLTASLFYYMCDYTNSKSLLLTWGILGVFVLSATKLGILLAIFVSTAFYYVRSLKHIILFIGIILGTILAIIYIDIPVFLRIRNVYELATNIPLEAYRNIGDSSAYEIGELYGTSNSGENDTSFVFRLVYWTKLLKYWMDSDFIHILFGYGDMYVKENFGLQPHNEYIKLLLENGICVFLIFCKFTIYVFNSLKPLKIRYLLFTPLVFIFTENILYFSFMNFLFFLVVGYFCCYSNERDINETNSHMYVEKNV